MNYSGLAAIRKRDKTKPKVGLVDQKLQEQKKISSVTSLSGRRLTIQTSLYNWTNVVEKVLIY